MARTKTPFAVLGLHASATAQDVRVAYRQLVKKCHPDRFQDPAEKAAAQERMIALNLAYEEALKLTSSRQTVENYNQELSLEEALDLGWKILADCFEKDETGIKSDLTDEHWPVK